jgi:hypothetical protein
VLDHLQTRRQLLFDVSANYLDGLSGHFERLAYLAGLREASTGKYIHEPLAARYGPEPVNEVLTSCHQEIFERLLEMPLITQEDSLRQYLKSWPGALSENVETCRDRAPGWVPPLAPAYLTALYSSNLAALLELLADNRTTPHPNT